MKFENKTAIFTGASSGMGLLSSQCYAREGGRVVMADITPETLETAVASVNEIRPGSAIGVVCDVRDYAQVCNVRDQVPAWVRA